MMRGLLPEISLDASEEKVRKDICDVINCSNDLVDAPCLCDIHDFEFIDMNGKHATVPINDLSENVKKLVQEVWPSSSM